MMIDPPMTDDERTEGRVMATRDTRDEQLSDEEFEAALVRVVILNQEGKRQLRADRRALTERAEKAERALAELVDVVANRPLDSEQVHSAFIRARDLVKERAKMSDRPTFREMLDPESAIVNERIRELAAALAEEREKNERLERDKTEAYMVLEHAAAGVNVQRMAKSIMARAALASTGSEAETCGADLTDRNDGHRTFICRKPATHTDSHQDGGCTWTDETHYDRASTGSEE